MFARGFKNWCETIAVHHRRALKLAPVAPLDPHAAAKFLDVQVRGVEEIPGLDPKLLRMLLEEDPDSWSAMTITNGRKSVIILNSSHRGGRPASDLMHELAHIIIGRRIGLRAVCYYPDARCFGLSERVSISDRLLDSTASA